MIRDRTMTRADFLKTCGALAAGAVCCPRPLEAESAGSVATEPVHLKSWEVVEFPKRKEKFRDFVKITATNGAVG